MPFFEFAETFVYYFPLITKTFETNTTFFLLEETIVIFPEIFLGFSLLFLLLHGVLVSSSSTKNYPLVQSSISNLVFLVLSLTFILTFNYIFSMKFSSFNSTLSFEILGVYSKQYFLLISMVSVVVVQAYLKDQQINSFEYFILVLFSIFGLMLLCSSNDFITAYLCIEIQSLSFYLLAAYKRNSIFATESGLKYFILGSFSSGLFLFCSSIIYGLTGTTNFEDLKDLFFYVEKTNFTYNIFEINMLSLGLTFILISLFFKLALAPFHIWSPDIYEGSLTSSTVFFAVLPKLSLFVFLVRLYQFSFCGFLEVCSSSMVLVGLLSVVVGSFVGLETRKVKSLLAYSSIGHMGYALLACSTASLEGLQSMLSYLIVYMLTSVCIWSIFLILRLRKLNIKKTNKDLSDFVALNRSNITLAVLFAVGLLSLAGFPPLIGFYVKVKIFVSLIEETQYLVAALAVLCSVISTFYYIRFIKVLFFEKFLVGNLYYPLEYVSSFIVSTCFFIFVYLFINPNFLYISCYKMCF
jgi:NADH-quinone oxidoreductase subunit N